MQGVEARGVLVGGECSTVLFFILYRQCKVNKKGLDFGYMLLAACFAHLLLPPLCCTLEATASLVLGGLMLIPW